VVAYTRGPGLAGALLVGAGVACALGVALGKPVLGVHHLEGHLLSPFLSADPPEFPFVALLVSGGHTQLMRVDGVGRYELLGETIDDAAGEAFDKSAKLMGLPYPGGPWLAKLAEGGNATAFKLPRPLLHSGDLDFSFAGLKTAVLTQAKKLGDQLEANKADLAASTQAAIVEVLLKKSLAALEQTGLKRLVVAGGVGANRNLREQLNAACARRGVRVHYPELHLCTDNGAMIAMAAAMRLQSGLSQASERYAFDVKPRWPMASLMPGRRCRRPRNRGCRARPARQRQHVEHVAPQLAPLRPVVAALGGEHRPGGRASASSLWLLAKRSLQAEAQVQRRQVLGGLGPARYCWKKGHSLRSGSSSGCGPVGACHMRRPPAFLISAPSTRRPR
jgi:N6-L-threonylcarbamoyladenine synthase